MYKKRLKLAVLIGLIVLTVVQTQILWLGDTSGLSFLSKKKGASYLTPVMPKGIWVTLGGGTLAHQVDHNTQQTVRQRERLVKEVQSMMINQLNESKGNKVHQFSWVEHLSSQGIWFEYADFVTLEDVIGMPTEHEMSQMTFDYIFLRILSSGEMAYLELINSEESSCYELRFKGDFSDLAQFVEMITSMQDENLITYQPTITSNINKHIKKNTFVPVTNHLSYDTFRLQNPLNWESENKIATLETYIDHFFNNPLLKNIKSKEDGTVVFTERQKSMVVYRSTGLMEYINHEPAKKEMPMSNIEAYNHAIKFIKNNEAIPENLRRRLYVERIEINEDEYTYYFGMNYNGYKVHLADRFKEALGVEALAQVLVKNHEIVSAKWLLLEVANTMENGTIKKGTLDEGYVKPIDHLLSKAGVTTPGSLVFEQIECVYVIEAMDQDVYMHWGVEENGTWHYQ